MALTPVPKEVSQFITDVSSSRRQPKPSLPDDEGGDYPDDACDGGSAWGREYPGQLRVSGDGVYSDGARTRYERGNATSADQPESAEARRDGVGCGLW